MQKLKDDGRIALVNVHLLEGFAGKEIVARYIKEKTTADGILSSKGFTVRFARQLGLSAVHRYGRWHRNHQIRRFADRLAALQQPESWVTPVIRRDQRMIAQGKALHRLLRLALQRQVELVDDALGPVGTHPAATIVASRQPSSRTLRC
ncbi:glycerol-3-phosphate responsive antiterminator [Streptomyces kronopolitis]|uniref:glycerol-3-phosphate responsive antiterminator n=1 Tax=Streptomyces kronopolitis TaxID=1612435 RepID=UPI00369C7040